MSTLRDIFNTLFFCLFRIRALVVDNTPGGTLGVTGETVALQSTPGGHIRRAERVAETWPLSSLA